MELTCLCLYFSAEQQLHLSYTLLTHGTISSNTCTPVGSAPQQNLLRFAFTENRGNKQTAHAGVTRHSGTVSSPTAPERLEGESGQLGVKRGARVRENKPEREGQVTATPVKHFF